MFIDMIVQMMHGYYAWFKMSIYDSSYIWHGIGMEWHNCISFQNPFFLFQIRNFLLHLAFTFFNMLGFILLLPTS